MSHISRVARISKPLTRSYCVHGRPFVERSLSLIPRTQNRVVQPPPSCVTRSLHKSSITLRAATVEEASTDRLEIHPAHLHQDNPIVRFDNAKAQVGVTWSSGIESKYHTIWLRDHCRCPKCYHAITKQRQFDTFSVPVDVQPVHLEATTEGLLVQWPRSKVDSEASENSENTENAEVFADNPHSSVYPWSWLFNNSYSPSLALGGSAGDSSTVDKNAVLWGSGIAQQPPTVPYADVMSDNDERGVANWLCKIAQFGFCFVSGVPTTPEDTERLIQRIAFIRETHYGGFWDFTSDLSHGDTAYTNLALGAHTDTTYFTDPAGLQMFHLLSHTDSKKGNQSTPAKGGESLLVDGFFAAKILREVHPEAYKILSSVPVATHSAGDDATLIRPLQRGGYPILEHDSLTGALIRVRYNNDDRSVLRIPDDQVLPFYDALNKWHRILTHKDSEYWSQLTPGNALIFDNHRVLHGRSAFTGQRRLCGAYVNHDDYRSRLAVLLKQYPDVLDGRRATLSPSLGTNSAKAAYSSNDGKSVLPQEAQKRGIWDDGL